MGLTISSVFSRLFGKKQMRILMGKSMQHVMGSSLITRYKGCNCDISTVTSDLKLIIYYLFFSVGLDAAGKTTILYKLKLGEIVTTIPTIGKQCICCWDL